MNTRKLSLLAIVAGLAASPFALAHGGHGPGGMGSGTGTTATAATVPTSAVSIDVSHACRGGGTRAMTGSYDPATGALSSSVTLADCVEGNATHNGSVTTSGTLTLSGTNVYALNLTSTYATTMTNGTDSVSRNCTWSKTGSYDLAAQTFTGSVLKTNCSLDLTETQRGDIVQHLLRDATQLDH
jgi:hypothetical protein